MTSVRRRWSAARRRACARCIAAVPLFEADVPDEAPVFDDPAALGVPLPDDVVDVPDTAGVADWPEVADGPEAPDPWPAAGAEGATPRGDETDGAFEDGSERCGVLGAEGVGTGGTVTEGVVRLPAGVGTVVEGTVVPWGNVTAPLGPALAARPEVSPTTSTTNTAIFRDMTGLERSSAREATPGGES